MTSGRRGSNGEIMVTARGEVGTRDVLSERSVVFDWSKRRAATNRRRGRFCSLSFTDGEGW